MTVPKPVRFVSVIGTFTNMLANFIEFAWHMRKCPLCNSTIIIALSFPFVKAFRQTQVLPAVILDA